MKHPTKRERGFTLVEVLIALVVLSFMMAAAVASIRTLATTQEKVEQRLVQLNEIRQVSGFLRTALSNAMPIQASLEGMSGYGTYLSGGPKEVIWVAPATMGVLGGTFVFRLFHEDDKLKLAFAPYENGITEPDWQSLEAQTLLDKVDAFTISYGVAYADELLDTWEYQLTLPSRVALSLKVNGKFWPELVVALKDIQLL
ncbi:prepilin-type N-terminal cleavage/methylation domain-containing protein [Neptunomonas sp. XY-337]|uniref:prepilin-type N-terminal cleavage/methylation domain-containing protein n=1 Tax=Neptunomonas sp. XY-337 TaxID=2561897 RepID=UPI0010AA3CA7|nr:prepilin-type N-terminal cleavage/methylation domain-containing protein [Neptunomonas sp. XY-337]